MTRRSASENRVPERKSLDSDLAAALKQQTAEERPEDVVPSPPSQSIPRTQSPSGDSITHHHPGLDTSMQPGSTVATGVINLPSRGLLYGGRLPEGAIQVTSMTAREEKLIAGARGDVHDLIDAILNRVMITKAVKPSDLLLTDRLYILFYVRANSYGPRYGWEITCRSCRRPFRHEVKIPGQIEVVDLPDDASEPFDVVLPRSGTKVGYRLLRGHDELAVLEHVDRQAKMGRTGGGWGDPAYIFRQAQQILYTIPGRIDEEKLLVEAQKLYDEGDLIEVDIDEAREFHGACMNSWVQDGMQNDLAGNDKRSVEARLAFIEGLIGADSQAFQDHAEKSDCGFKLTVDLQCPTCSNWFMEEPIPLTAEFFRPARRESRRHS